MLILLSYLGNMADGLTGFILCIELTKLIHLIELNEAIKLKKQMQLFDEIELLFPKNNEPIKLIELIKLTELVELKQTIETIELAELIKLRKLS